MLNHSSTRLLLGITLVLFGANIISAQDADLSSDDSPQPPRVHARVGEIVHADAAEVGVSTVQRWILVGRPQGSRVSLGRAWSPTLSFVPDVSGGYAVRAINPDGPSPLLEIFAGPSKTLVPVETRVPGAGGIFNTVVNGVSYSGGNSTGSVFGVVSAGFSFGVDLANAPDGNSTVVDAQTKASEPAAQAVESFLQERAAQGLMFASIYDDWGKLQMLGKALRSRSPEWAWLIGITDTQLLDGLNRSARRSFYQSLLSAVYVRRIWNAQKSQWTKATDYKYESSILNWIY